MLFNSYEFLIFLVPVLFFFHVFRSAFDRRVALIWIALCSLFFYGWWAPKYLILLILSISVNYFFGRLIARSRASDKFLAIKLLLCLGIVFNLSLLAYFKYAGLIMQAVDALRHDSYTVIDIVLPLAISFFTFQQIAYLVDIAKGEAVGAGFLDYLVFVTFFPQLIAGPIVHHSEMMPQFSSRAAGERLVLNLQVGFTLFTFGLAKKVLIADNLALIADASFALSETGTSQGTFSAWFGVSAYTLQIYFDFSGYSDMALGLAVMFGIRLPANFLSPYRSCSIIDFWRRWHITLSRFLRDYLYVSLGGNRKGRPRRYVNLMLTMLLGGLWHGATIQFVFWGGLHGIFLVINHGWHRISRAFGIASIKKSRVYSVLAWLLTLLATMVAWVFFRANSFDGAVQMLSDMFLYSSSTDLKTLYTHRISDADLLINNLLGQKFAFNEFWIFSFYQDLLILLLASLVCFLLPNTLKVMDDYRPSCSDIPSIDSAWPDMVDLRWQPVFPWAVLVGLLFLVSFLSLARVAPFLYFQF